MSKENSEQILYSAPKIKEFAIEKKASALALFIEAIEQALANQTQLFRTLQQDKLLPEDERESRIEETQKNIQSILDRIAEEKEKKNVLESEIKRLKRIHGVGLQLLRSVKQDNGKAN